MIFLFSSFLHLRSCIGPAAAAGGADAALTCRRQRGEKPTTHIALQAFTAVFTLSQRNTQTTKRCALLIRTKYARTSPRIALRAFVRCVSCISRVVFRFICVYVLLCLSLKAIQQFALTVLHPTSADALYFSGAPPHRHASDQMSWHPFICALS